MMEKGTIEDLIGSAKPSVATEPQAAPARLKSRIYSQLMKDLAGIGPLLSLPETKASGAALCVFEELVRIAPIGEPAKTRNCCRVCHARILAEHLEGPPIYWPHCPYVGFQNR